MMMTSGNSEYIEKIRIKKDKIKEIDLAPLLLDEGLLAFDKYNKIVFVSVWYNEWDSRETTIEVEKNEDEIIVTCNEIVEHGESGAELSDKHVTSKITIEYNERNANLFRLLCKETFKVAHFIHEDETGYDFISHAKLFDPEKIIRTDFNSPLMIAILLIWTDVPNPFVCDALDCDDLPKRDAPVEIFVKKDDDIAPVEILPNKGKFSF